MIANALRVEIERYAARMPASNSLYIKAEDGTFTPSCMIRYLSNVRHLVAYTTVFLSKARDRARQLGDEPLAKHFEHKRGEELGHEAWADRDIERVSTAAVVPANADILESTHDLVTFLGATIDEDPVRYRSYALFAEYFTLLLGPAWLQLLEERCGIPRSSMTVVGNHIELDRDHVEAALDEIDALVADPTKLPRMREVLLDSFAHFDRFCAEVTSLRDASYGSGLSRDAARHVSAA